MWQQKLTFDLPHFAHAAFADGGEDRVVAELGAGLHGQIRLQVGGHVNESVTWVSSVVWALILPSQSALACW